MSVDIYKVSEYLNQSKFIILATIKHDAPVVRTLASFASEGLTTYISTGKSTAKVEQIHANPKVTVFFQHENQDLASYVNVSIIGTANQITAEEEVDKAIKLIADRSPNFKARAEKGELVNNIFFRVDAQEVKVLDFAKGVGPKAVEVITV